jgi:hypothetical protein
MNKIRIIEEASFVAKVDFINIQKEQHKSLDVFQLDKCKLFDSGTFVYKD